MSRTVQIYPTWYTSVYPGLMHICKTVSKSDEWALENKSLQFASEDIYWLPAFNKSNQY